MLKIRFQRTGRKNDPAYRIVVVEHTAGPRAGKNVAQVGSYNPKTKQTVIDAEAVKKWIGHGAKPSGTVHNLLVSKSVIEGKKVNVLSRKTPIEKEEEQAGEEKPESDGGAAETPTEEEVSADPETGTDEVRVEATDASTETGDEGDTPTEEKQGAPAEEDAGDAPAEKQEERGVEEEKKPE
ncbi:MAG: 30S ribosomal protein S16 [Candidatus Paceibacteria bacterium]